ncbi:MAG: 50S ribosomal protein L32 [Clostridia bacterium]|nr:50S ribosomal protein L32 [Clostridia bacterium]
MAVPKRKSSHARKNTRRNNVWKLQAPALSKCPNCGEWKAPHRVCAACGDYNGRQVLVFEED